VVVGIHLSILSNSGSYLSVPIQEQHTEMDIEIQRTAESLAGFILIDGARFFSPFPRRV